MNGTSSMTLSVVIVNYNVCDLLLACIESLALAMDGLDGEIIVVDNASTDGAVAAIREHFPHVQVIALDRNLGFGAANNIGIDVAKGEYILILNPDTIVQEDTIHVMLRFMQGHDDAVFAGCRIILPDGTLDPVSKRGFPSPWSSFCRVFGLSRLFPRSRVFGGYNLTYVPDDLTSQVDALAGCFMFCRAAALKSLGGFDTDFFMYGEDLDLCYRARKEGGNIYYHPATSIMHRKGESTRRSSIDALALFYEAMEIFASKHFRRNILLLWLVRIGIAVRRAVARTTERYPGWSFAFIDIVAAVTGFVIGSLLKFGTPFDYPAWATPFVWGVPPALFVLAIGAAGGYALDDRTPSKALLGVLVGFFVLSTLPYFFKEYAFSRGVVIVTTGVVALTAVLFRFGRLLYRRTFGDESIRRVAVIGRRMEGRSVRTSLKRLFVTRPVVYVGTIAPTVSEMEATRGDELGSVDNIKRIIADHRLSDVVVVDTGLGYTEVLRAMELAGSRRVRFHVLHGRRELTESVAGEVAVPPVAHGSVASHSRRRKRLRERIVALIVLVLAWPAVYWATDNAGRVFSALWDVVLGRRGLVGSGVSAPEPVFSMASLIGAADMTSVERDALEHSYLTSRSLLLDAEIVVEVVRAARSRRRGVKSKTAKAVGREGAVGRTR